MSGTAMTPCIEKPHMRFESEFALAHQRSTG